MKISNILYPINATKVNSVIELIEIIKEANANGQMWFRGQKDIMYPLLPSVIRRAMVICDQCNRPVKPYCLDTFSTHGDECIIPDNLYLNSFKKFLEAKHIEYHESGMEFMCLAQHYGVRTRLLDWTTDASVALFFAMDGREEGTPAGFYILNPEKLNDCSIMCRAIPNYNELEGLSAMFPVAFYGPKKDKRMCRQSGNFTLHGNMVWPIDYIYTADTFLKRIEIPNKVCQEIEDILFAMGITRDSIYIDDDILDEISKEAQLHTEEVYNNKIQLLTEEWEKTDEKGISNHLFFELEI